MAGLPAPPITLSTLLTYPSHSHCLCLLLLTDRNRKNLKLLQSSQFPCSVGTYLFPVCLFVAISWPGPGHRAVAALGMESAMDPLSLRWRYDRTVAGRRVCLFYSYTVFYPMKAPLTYESIWARLPPLGGLNLYAPSWATLLAQAVGTQVPSSTLPTTTPLGEQVETESSPLQPEHPTRLNSRGESGISGHEEPLATRLLSEWPPETLYFGPSSFLFSLDVSVHISPPSFPAWLPTDRRPLSLTDCCFSCLSSFYQPSVCPLPFFLLFLFILPLCLINAIVPSPSSIQFVPAADELHPGTLIMRQKKNKHTKHTALCGWVQG